jgi:hypothetical protein
MRSHFFISLLCLAAMICSCSSEINDKIEQDNTQEETKEMVEYFSLKYDTTVSENDISTTNGTLYLIAKHYSLNDSAVENKIYLAGDDDKLIPAKSIAHNYQLEITISNDSTTLKVVKISKETFADCINSKSLERRYLYNYWIDSAMTDKCIMRIGIGVPDTDDACHVKFSLSLLPESLGQVNCEEIIPLEYGD